MTVDQNKNAVEYEGVQLQLLSLERSPNAYKKGDGIRNQMKYENHPNRTIVKICLVGLLSFDQSHINLHGLFNAKDILEKTNSSDTI